MIRSSIIDPEMLWGGRNEQTQERRTDHHEKRRNPARRERGACSDRDRGEGEG
jgi:hypothetical protein